MKGHAFFLALAIALFSITACDDDEVNVLESTEFIEFNQAMRDLWSDHVVWTRNVIINFVDQAPGTTEAVNRLSATRRWKTLPASASGRTAGPTGI